MPDTVIVALVTGICAVIAQLIIARSNSQKLMSQLEKQSEIADLKLEGRLEAFTQVTDTKIEELTREVRQHNNFAQRMPVIEEKVKQLENKVQ